MILDWFKKNYFYCISLVFSLTAILLLSVPIDGSVAFSLFGILHSEEMDLRTSWSIILFLYTGLIGLCLFILFSIFSSTPLMKWKAKEEEMLNTKENIAHIAKWIAQILTYIFFIFSFSLFAVNLGTTNKGISKIDMLFDIAGACYFISAVFLLLGSPNQFLRLLKNNTKEVIGIAFTCIGMILLAFPSQIQNTYMTIGGATISEDKLLQSSSYTYFDMFHMSPKLIFPSFLPLILIALGVFGKGLLCQKNSSNKGYFVGITDGLIFAGVVLISRTLASFVDLSGTNLNIAITASKDWGSIAGLIVIFLANGISIAFNLFSMQENSEFLEKNERIFILITWMIILYSVLVGCVIWL